MLAYICGVHAKGCMASGDTVGHLRIKKNFESTKEDGDSVAKTGFPGVLTHFGLILWVRSIP